MKRISLTVAAMMLCMHLFGQNVFTTDRDRLVDANGNAFVIRGMNNPHAWFAEKAFKALDYIQKTGSNTVRIVWQTDGKDADLERIIRRCIELEMIPMVELHDVTGRKTKESLLDMARWYSRPERAAMLKQYERYLLLNIANEWGDHSVSSEKWLECYSEAVSVMRQAGFNSTIVVDGPGWGQNITPFIKKGQDLIDADPLHNILFSIHMYGSWNKPGKIEKDLRRCHDLGLPLVVGEFGYNFSNGKNNLGCKVDHRTILKVCNDLDYGYMPWSWTGNNEQNQWLDLVDPSDWKTLTWWGEQVIEQPGGIRQSAKVSSVFR